MWFVYVPLVVVILVAAGSAFIGFLPGVIIAVVLLLILGALALTRRAQTMEITSTEAPAPGPSTREAAYEPRVDPGSTPTGGSTAS